VLPQSPQEAWRAHQRRVPIRNEATFTQFINPPPDGPTPSGFVYYLPNPTQNGALVSFDDCEKVTGILFDFKGLSYARLTNDLSERMAYEFIEQATRQLAASGGRPVVWIFAEEEAALFVRKLFNAKAGFERITIGYIPWPGSGQ
jgi:NADPH-dependent ferric siderophore reductase